ncbi:hypothetical protein HMPREF0262_02366 [Clostridium sp. ATCC 29733]|nr:hypothetical protein HMPREF0262_02366 [Clostridium sp. ATCC 29733]
MPPWKKSTLARGGGRVLHWPKRGCPTRSSAAGRALVSCERGEERWS